MRVVVRSVSIAVVILTIVAIVSCCAATKVVTYTMCPDDQLTCGGSSCMTETFNQDQCYPLSSNTTVAQSQTFTCLHSPAICARVAGFDGQTCGEAPVRSEALICGQCYKQNDTSYERLDCKVNDDNSAYVNVVRCTDGLCLENCTTIAVFQQRQCFTNTHRVNASSRLVGLEVCGMVQVTPYITSYCNIVTGSTYLPRDMCLNGVKVSCS